MRSDENVPIEERYLVVEGHLSAKTRQTVRKGLRAALAPTSRVCFVSCAYADLPLPRAFDAVFPVNQTVAGKGATVTGFAGKHLARAESTAVRIEAAMDTEYRALGTLPDAANTICILEFPSGVPFMIDDLPTVKDWGESDESVVLCSRETLHALKDAARRPR